MYALLSITAQSQLYSAIATLSLTLLFYCVCFYSDYCSQNIILFQFLRQIIVEKNFYNSISSLYSQRK